MPVALQTLDGGYRLRVKFEDGLQLADMKARLDAYLPASEEIANLMRSQSKNPAP